MSQLHDYTQINWGDDATFDAPLQEIQGAIISQSPMREGDEIILSLRCRVNEVQNLSSNPDAWKAKISFLSPFPANSNSDATPPQFLHQIVQHLGSSIQHSGLFQQLERSRSIDPVTHAVVRAKLDNRLEQEWRRMETHRTPLALILGEVDQLGAYCKTYGEQACDDGLRQLVKAINSSANRPGDLVARYQGATLALLLPNTSLDAAICIAKKIRWRIKALPIVTALDQTAHHFTISLGISGIVPTLELTPENLVAGAEASLRQAQRAGGDKIIWQEGGV